MLIALRAGAVDVLTAGKAQALRTGAVCSAVCLAAALWVAPIVWLLDKPVIEEPSALAVVSIATVIAIAPPIGFAYQVVRSGTPQAISALGSASRLA